SVAVLITRADRPWLFAVLVLSGLTAAGYAVLTERLPEQLPAYRFGCALVGAGLVLYAAALRLHRRQPRWWHRLGSRRVWLLGHVWLGLLSVVPLLCHADFRLGGWLTGLLWLALAITLVSGVVGVVLQRSLAPFLGERFRNLAEPPWWDRTKGFS